MAPRKQVWPKDPERFGQKVLGEILRDVRKRAGLSTDFATKSPGMRSSFVRMVESGNAYVPQSKTSAYAAALSVNAAAGGPAIDPERLLFAFTSLRALKDNISDVRFDWPFLYESASKTKSYADAKKHVYEQLTRGPAFVEGGQGPESIPEFDLLNSMQLQLVKDIAQRISVFGSAVVNEKAVATWEAVNAPQIKTVLAAVRCLQSELSPAFLESINLIAGNKEFAGFRYLVADSNRNAVSAAFDEVKRRMGKSGQTVIRKFRHFHITLPEFDEINRIVDPEGKKGWDAIYLYKRHSGPDLMFGVFRRFSPRIKEIPPVTLRSWAAEPMNEILSHRNASEFMIWHQGLWEEREKRYLSKSKSVSA